MALRGSTVMAVIAAGLLCVFAYRMERAILSGQCAKQAAAPKSN